MSSCEQLLVEISRDRGGDAAQAAEVLLDLAKPRGNGVSLAENANCVTIRVKPPSFRNPISIAWLNLPRGDANYGGTGFDVAFGTITYKHKGAKPPPDHVLDILSDWAKECADLPSVQFVPQNDWAVTYAMAYYELPKEGHLQAVYTALEGIITRIRNERHS